MATKCCRFLCHQQRRGRQAVCPVDGRICIFGSSFADDCVGSRDGPPITKQVRIGICNRRLDLFGANVRWRGVRDGDDMGVTTRLRNGDRSEFVGGVLHRSIRP